jgi:hypothetical protein
MRSMHMRLEVVTPGSRDSPAEVPSNDSARRGACRSPRRRATTTHTGGTSGTSALRECPRASASSSKSATADSSPYSGTPIINQTSSNANSNTGCGGEGKQGRRGRGHQRGAPRGTHPAAVPVQARPPPTHPLSLERRNELAMCTLSSSFRPP